MSWLRLIRWSNLLIILLTQLLVWYCLLLPLREAHGIALLLTPLNFSLLCVSTMLIAAAGYIINDYFDIRIDTINKPDKVILERKIPRRMAIIVHSAMNAAALLMAGIVAWQGHHPEWLLLQLLCTFLLWRYSTTWKRQFMIGNVVVALMTALTIVALVIYEPVLLTEPRKVIPGWHITIPIAGYGPVDAMAVLFFFAFFAFVLTWMREIVKDMEDYKGDDAEGCVTMPIRWGLLRTMRFVQLLGSVAIMALTYAGYRLFYLGPQPAILGYYIFLALIIPLFGWLLFLPRKATTQHFGLASRYLKIIMVLGIGSLLLYRFQYG